MTLDLEAVRRALADGPDAGGTLTPLADTGLAHWHVALAGTGRLLRIPKQSQMALAPVDNLAYQAACFARAGASGHTPRLHDLLPPSEDLPMGALIVGHVEGRPPRLPEDLAAIAQAFAAIHALALPEPAARPPLLDPGHALVQVMAEVQTQAAYLDQAAVAGSVRRHIDREIAAAGAEVADASPPPKRLISFDGHPGNFLITGDGAAILVDLEKARYGQPGFDLAHATLYTSTTWDLATCAELSVDQIRDFLAAWCAALPPDLAATLTPWLMATRRIMWLWSVTWCAKWRVLHGTDRRRADGAASQDWSAELTDDATVAHVRGRVDTYLSEAVIDRVLAEFAALAADAGAP